MPNQSSPSVRQANTEDQYAWDNFVANSQWATFFHRFGWKLVLERSFGHKTHYLIAEERGQIVGILPLAELKSLLFGHHLVSTPFCVYGGPLGESHIQHKLIEAAGTLARSIGVEDLEIRSTSRMMQEWPEKQLYVTFRKPISADHDQNLQAIPRKQRAMVRKGIAAGLNSEASTDIDRFYRIYAESVRNLGTPVFTKSYLQNLLVTFADDCEIRIIRSEQRDVAAVMSFYFKNEVLPYYAGSIPEARALKANDFMYWDLMCRAADEGSEIFDFGRSKLDTGAYSFKKNWGFEPTPLHYEYLLLKTDEIPQHNPSNPRYTHLVNTWRRLPLPVANTLGPMLAKQLG